MAFPFFDSLKLFLPANVLDYYAEVLRSNDLHQVIDFAMLDLEQVQGLSKPGDSPNILVPFWEHACTFVDGWSTLVVSSSKVNAAASSTSRVAPVLPSNCPVGPCPVGASSSVSFRPSSSSGAVLSNIAKATKRSAFAFSTPAKKRPKPPTLTGSLESREAALMERAKIAINDIFVEFASGSPRFLALALNGGSALLWDMQRDTYRLRSRSHRVVARRAIPIRNFFLDMRAYGWDWMALTPFMVAAWVRGKVLGCPVSTAIQAKDTLRIISQATDVNLHFEHPTVLGQFAAASSPTSCSEPSAQPLEITVEMMIALESYTVVAPTPQLRCFAGFSSFLDARLFGRRTR